MRLRNLDHCGLIQAFPQPTVFRNHLKLLNSVHDFDATKLFPANHWKKLDVFRSPLLWQISKEMESRFMSLSCKMKTYEICFPSGELTDVETAKNCWSQFYLAIRSIIYKQTKGDAPDAEVMNRVVEKMVQEAISCTGIENIVNAG